MFQILAEIGTGNKFVVKNQLKQFYSRAEFLSISKYNVRQVYDKLMRDLPHIFWDKFVWKRLSVPKHRFIVWLVVQGRLQTTNKLTRIGVSNTTDFLICSRDNGSHSHSFSECHFRKASLNEIMRWMRLNATTNDLSRLIRWISRSKCSRFKGVVWTADISVVIYMIWSGGGSRN